MAGPARSTGRGTRCPQTDEPGGLGASRAPHDSRTMSSQCSRMSRAGRSVRATRSSIAASAASPICRRRLPQRGQRHRQQLARTRHRRFRRAGRRRNRVAEPQQCRHQPRRRPIVGADDARRAAASRHERAHGLGVRGIEPVHQRAVDRDVPRVQRLAIAGLARVDRGGGVRERDERDPPRAEPQQVLGDDVAGAPVVDADQIVVAALAGRARRCDRAARRECAPSSSARAIRWLTSSLSGESSSGAKNTPETRRSMYCRHSCQARVLPRVAPRRAGCPR